MTVRLEPFTIPLADWDLWGAGVSYTDAPPPDMVDEFWETLEPDVAKKTLELFGDRSTADAWLREALWTHGRPRRVFGIKPAQVKLRVAAHRALRTIKWSQWSEELHNVYGITVHVGLEKADLGFTIRESEPIGVDQLERMIRRSYQDYQAERR